MNIKNPFSSIKSMLKQIILDQNYSKPEDILAKAEKFLEFLKTSPHEQDRKKYQEILNKIQMDHNLKPLFDYYFKKKREERLKMFLLLQIQKKGKGAKHLRSKSHGKKDEKDKEDDFIYQAFKYHKSDFKEHEAFQLLDIKVKTEEYVKQNKPSFPYKIIDGKNTVSLKNKQSVSHLKEERLNALLSDLSIEEKRVIQEVKELDLKNQLEKQREKNASSYKDKLEQGTLSSNKNTIGLKNRDEIQTRLQEEKEKDAFNSYQSPRSHEDAMKIDFVGGEDFVNNILDMVNKQNALKEKQDQIKANLRISDLDSQTDKQIQEQEQNSKKNNTIASDFQNKELNNINQHKNKFSSNIGFEKENTKDKTNSSSKSETKNNENKMDNNDKELSPRSKQIFDTLPKAYQEHIAKNPISYQEAILKHYGYRKEFNNEDFENSLNYVKVNQILNSNGFDFDNMLS